MTTCIVPGCKTQKSGAKVSLHLFPDPCREPERHLKWVRALCAEKVLTKDPTHVFKQLRVCRSHFDEKSFNGICKKLLGSAIPTLNLGPTRINHCKTKLLLYETKLKNILRKNSTDIQEESFQLVSDAVERCEVPALSLEHEELSHHDKMWLSGIDIIDESVEETYELMEVESPQGHGEQFRLVMKKEQDRLKTSNYSTKEPKRNLAACETSLAPLNPRNLHKLRNDFNKSEKIQLARRICSLHDPLDILIKESNSCETVYQHTVDLLRVSQSN